MGRGTKDKSEYMCFECGDFGYFAYECTKWKERDKEKEWHLIYEGERLLL